MRRATCDFGARTSDFGGRTSEVGRHEAHGRQKCDLGRHFGTQTRSWGSLWEPKVRFWTSFWYQNEVWRHRKSEKNESTPKKGAQNEPVYSPQLSFSWLLEVIWVTFASQKRCQNRSRFRECPNGRRDRKSCLMEAPGGGKSMILY